MPAPTLPRELRDRKALLGVVPSLETVLQGLNAMLAGQRLLYTYFDPKWAHAPVTRWTDELVGVSKPASLITFDSPERTQVVQIPLRVIGEKVYDGSPVVAECITLPVGSLLFGNKVYHTILAFRDEQHVDITGHYVFGRRPGQLGTFIHSLTLAPSG